MTENWMKSSYSCGQNNCVETRLGEAEGVDVRDSKNTGLKHIAVGREAWAKFVELVR
jgi:hypothetical protein